MLFTTMGQRISHSLVAPPIYSTERYVAPHGQGEATPEAGDTLCVDKMLHAIDSVSEDTGAGGGGGLHSGSEHLDW